MKKFLTMILCATYALCGATQTLSPNGMPYPRQTDMVTNITPRHAETEWPSLEFSYAKQVSNSLSLKDVKAGDKVFLMFQMKPEDIKAFAGNIVTGFNIYSPTSGNMGDNPIESATLYVSTGIDTTPIKTQEIALYKRAFHLNRVDFDVPYLITGDEPELYFGYIMTLPSETCYYIPVDQTPNSYRGSSLIGVSHDDTPPQADNWISTYDTEGALAMSITIAGKCLPENMASIESVDFPRSIPLSGDGSSYDVTVRNTSLSPISSISFATSVSGMPIITQSVNVDVSYGQSVKVTLDGIKGSQTGVSNIGVRIIDINGQKLKVKKLWERP